MFDFISYMERLARENKLAHEQAFTPTTCSGLNYLEGMLEQYQSVANFICTSDVCAESTFMASGGWFKRRVFTVFLIMRYEYGNREDYAAKLSTCRELFRQLQSRFIRDSETFVQDMNYLNVGDIRSNELGGTFLNSCTGLYFMLSMDEPTELCYDANEWRTD